MSLLLSIFVAILIIYLMIPVQSFLYLAFSLPFLHLIKKIEGAASPLSALSTIIILNLGVITMSRLGVDFAIIGYSLAAYAVLININNHSRLNRANKKSYKLEKFTGVGENIGILLYILQLLLIGSVH
jgi:hypothetical protein